MRVDAQLSFVPIGSPLSLVGGAGVAIPSTNVIDLLGLGVGVTPASAGQIIGQTATIFGTDPGVGGRRPELNVTIGTAVTTGNGAVMKIALQGAPDNGSGSPGTWVDIDSQDNITAASLTAGSVPFRTPWIPDFPPNLLPRFLRLLFSPTTGTNFSAGTVASALVTVVRDDQANKFAAKNYKVA